MLEAAPSIRCRAAFISDIHLGTRGCQAELLLEFIRELDCETLYLVGDIFDGWKMKSGWYWPQAHNDVVQKVLRIGGDAGGGGAVGVWRREGSACRVGAGV